MRPNNVESDMYRTPVEFEQVPDGPHRDKGDASDRSAPSEQEETRRGTLYLVLDPDQDPSCSSEAILLVGTREELRGKTGGGDVFEKGF